MSLVEEQRLFLLDAARLVLWCEEAGWIVTGGELWRTPQQQALYVQAGRSTTMASNHLRRCAIDLNFFRDGQLVYDRAALLPVGTYWESLSSKNSWGGNWNSFKDIPHFERRP